MPSRLSLLFLILTIPLCWRPADVSAKETLRLLTWDGYVTDTDLVHVNKLLQSSGYDIEAKVITPYAEGAEQMFGILRRREADIAFLTLYFIKLQGAKTARLLQPINADSPRLSNYKHLLPDLRTLPMGMEGTSPLYIPFAGGSYGFYVNRKQVAASEVPVSWADLLKPRWQGKYSLNRTQVWYNVAIASMVLGKPPYFINELMEGEGRNAVTSAVAVNGPLAQTLTSLYRNAGDFWDAGPSFPPHLEIISSWGSEMKQANREGGDWRLIKFKEGDLVWLDTINFAKELAGKRLEAAEIVANYFIGKEVQTRVAEELSLVSVSALAAANPVLKADPKFFSKGTFVPPYHTIADNFMTRLSSDALKAVGR